MRSWWPLSLPAIWRVLEFFQFAILPVCQYGFCKGLSTNGPLLHSSYVLQSALDHGHEAKIVQIDFSAAFDRVNHKGLLFKLKSVGIGGSIFSAIHQFLIDRKQCMSVDGSLSSFLEFLRAVCLALCYLSFIPLICFLL